MAETKEDKEVWEEIKELRKEMYQEFKNLREEIHKLDIKIEQVDKSLREEIHKLKLLIVIVIFLIIFLNQNALEFLLRVLGLLK